jgi:hypothetical protein
MGKTRGTNRKINYNPLTRVKVDRREGGGKEEEL